MKLYVVGYSEVELNIYLHLQTWERKERYKHISVSGTTSLWHKTNFITLLNVEFVVALLQRILLSFIGVPNKSARSIYLYIYNSGAIDCNRSNVLKYSPYDSIWRVVLCSCECDQGGAPSIAHVHASSVLSSPCAAQIRPATTQTSQPSWCLQPGSHY